eukprot:3072984-Lingulodinium_polyedra.AAC.1
MDGSIARRGPDSLSRDAWCVFAPVASGAPACRAQGSDPWPLPQISPAAEWRGRAMAQAPGVPE